MNPVEPWLLRGGLICDGSGSKPFRGDVLLRDGRIEAITPGGGNVPAGLRELDAAPYVVTPGLVDLHVHVYDGMNLHSLAPAAAGLRTGVTTMLDTGSAGAMNYGTFAKYVIPSAPESIYTLLNISCFGVQGHPDISPHIADLHDEAHFDVEAALRCMRAYPDQIVGVKVRLTGALADHCPAKERAALAAALQVRDQSGLPLMVHHVMSSIPLPELLAQLQAGDILTHFYHGMGDGGFTAEGGGPGACLLDARERGVILDVGHGSGCFKWTLAEAACGVHQFWPDTISTDLHVFNLVSPVVDLPTTMTKFLHLGMPLEAVVQACTASPADAMGQPQLGRLEVGAPADVSLLRWEEGAYELMDSHGETRTVTKRLVPGGVFKNGQYWTE